MLPESPRVEQEHGRPRVGLAGKAMIARGIPTWLEWFSILSMALASGFIVWAVATRPKAATLVAQPLPVPTAPIEVAGAPQKGSAAAPVVVIVYSDFECPYCRKFALQTLPQLTREYVDTGRVRLVFRNLPLDAMHPSARSAAVAGLCAERQAKFWEWQDLVFRKEPPLRSDVFTSAAREAGLDAQEYHACLASPQTVAAVDSDVAGATALGIQGTPSFIIGRSRPDGTVAATQVFSGLRPFANFKGVLDLVLASSQ